MYKFSGSPRAEGDNEEDDVDDVENEFNHMHGSGQATLRWQQGEDVNISSSSRHGSQPIPLSTNGQRVSYKDKEKKNTIPKVLLLEVKRKKKKLMLKVLCQYEWYINSHN